MEMSNLDRSYCLSVISNFHVSYSQFSAKIRPVSVAGADANPDDCPNNWTPLHAAVESHRSEVVPLLLQTAADPNISRTEDGWTPLHFAARSGDLKIAPRQR
jgi:hypothetical protein